MGARGGGGRGGGGSGGGAGAVGGRGPIEKTPIRDGKLCLRAVSPVLAMRSVDAPHGRGGGGQGRSRGSHRIGEM